MQNMNYKRFDFQTNSLNSLLNVWANKSPKRLYNPILESRMKKKITNIKK